jgi:hypothetical protein
MLEITRSSDSFQDLDPESNPAADGRQRGSSATAVLQAQAEQRRIPVLVRGIGLSLAATLALGLVLFLVLIHRRTLGVSRQETNRSPLTVRNIDLRPFLASVERGLVKTTGLEWD